MLRVGRTLAAFGLLGVPGSVQLAHAVDATWQGPGIVFTNGSNWSGGNAATGIATFTNNGAPTSIVDFSAGATVGTLQFNAGAPAYTLTIGDGTATTNFTVNGTGVVNNSGVAQTLVVEAASILRFTGAASAGSATLSSTGGLLLFQNTATGGTARVILAAGSDGLALQGTSGAISIGSLEGAGQLRFFTNANTLTIGALGTDTTYSGLISQVSGGTGAIVKVGAGTLTLTNGGNGYTLGTTVTGGTLAYTAIGALGTGGVTLDGGALLADVTGTTTNALTFGAGTTSTLAAATGQTATFSGPVSLQSGALAQLGRLGATGTLVMSGVVSGAGGVSVQSGTTTILSANNTYTGGTSIAAGARLQVGNGFNAGAIVGDVVNNGTLAFNRIGFLELAGVVSGTGAVEKSVGGILALTGANTYSGGTTINTGILQIGNGGTTGSIVGNVAVNGAGLLSFDRSNSLTFGGQITGTGGIVQAGTGTTILTGQSTFTGGTSIEAGTLQIGNGGTAGAIVGNVVVGDGTLAFNRSDTVTFSGVISRAFEGAAGNLEQRGPGTLILTANNTYQGTTTVTAGTLLVNGSIASSSLLTVDAGATVGGLGTLPRSVINGTLSPGMSPGTITVAGNLTFGAGGTYLVEVQGPVADRTNVTGTATLNGTLRLVPLGGSYAFNTPYVLLNAAGGRTGTFTTVDSLFGASILTSVSYDAQNVLLTLAPATLAPPPGGGNGTTVTTAINTGVNNGGDATPFFPVFTAPTDALPQVVATLSGEVHTARVALGFEVSDQFLRVMLDPFALGRSPGSNPALAYASDALAGLPAVTAATQAADLAGDVPAPFDSRRFAVWAAAFGTDSRVGGDAATGSHRLDTRTANIAVGADMRVAPDTVVGFAAAGGTANASLSEGLGALSAEVGQAGAYVMSRLGGLNIGAAIAYTSLDIDSSRSIPVLGGTSLSGDYRVEAWSGRAEASVEALRWSGFALAPLAAFQAHAIRSPSLTETVGAGGVGAAALAVQGDTQHVSRSELGVRLDGSHRFDRVDLTVFARLAWAHYFDRDATVIAAFTGLPGSTFQVVGAQVDRNAALVSVGLDLRFTPQLSFGARFDGELAEHVARYAGTARVRLAF